MKFIDLDIQRQKIEENLKRRVDKVISEGKYIMGPEVQELEEKLSSFCGVRHAISCSSGTDALLLALLAKSIKCGDAVFTTPFTFIATAEVISLIGATPVFVDIDPKTFNIDPVKLKNAIQAIENNDSSIHPLPNIKTVLEPKAIITVDLFGLPADYKQIQEIAGKHDLFLIEDAAQSFGAELKGRRACSFGNIACTSFFPAKPLGCYGDGGMCFTNDDELAEIMESLRVHGKGHHKYDNVRIGVNGRLDTLQAGILLTKFEIFPEEIELRQQVAQRYTQLLESISSIQSPEIPNGYKSAWAQYSILVDDDSLRTDLQNRLKEAGIPTAVYYPKPLHLQTAFEYLGYQEGDFPVSEDYSKRIFSLPMHPYLEPEDQERIVEVMEE